MFLDSDRFCILSLFSWGFPNRLAPQRLQETSHYGASCTQTEPAVWLLGDEGETWDGRLWACLPVPAPCKFCHPPVCKGEHKTQQTQMSLWLGLITVCLFVCLFVFGAGAGREDRGETLPHGAELQEQRPLGQRDSDHEEVSVNHPQTSLYIFFFENHYWIILLSSCYRLNHVNVVQAREVPEELSSIALNDLPLLAMEYCSRGDLRKVPSGYFIKTPNNVLSIQTLPC